MFDTASPLGRYRVSGSAPRFPTRMTLFTDAINSSLRFTFEGPLPLVPHHWLAKVIQFRNTMLIDGRHLDLAQALDLDKFTYLATHIRNRIAQPLTLQHAIFTARCQSQTERFIEFPWPLAVGKLFLAPFLDPPKVRSV